MNYYSYIRSRSWLSRHPSWLKRSKYRCAMFPWVKVGKGHSYHCHHMSYKNLGYEKLYRDVIVLSPFAHNLIIHGILSLGQKPSQQSHYPNLLQRIAHFWCCLPILVKVPVLLGLVIMGARRMTAHFGAEFVDLLKFVFPPEQFP